MCVSHYGQWRKHGVVTPIRVPVHRTVVGGGYIRIKDDDHPNANAKGWVLEHVKVMSESLGRALLPEETVHHKNGDRADNRIENLELWNSGQPKGQRIEDKVTWAKEILALYDGALPSPTAVGA